MDNSTLEETRQTVLRFDEPWIDVSIHDYTLSERKQFFVHPVLMNEALTEYDDEDLFIHISDDDLPDPDFIRTLIGFFNFNRDKSACYVPMRQMMISADGEISVLHAQMPPSLVIFNETINPNTQLDGNCTMFRVETLRKLGKPWRETWNHAGTLDGQMLSDFVTKLNEKIWPASSEVLMNHRITPQSTFVNSVYGLRDDIYKDPLQERIFGKLESEVTNGASQTE